MFCFILCLCSFKARLDLCLPLKSALISPHLLSGLCSFTHTHPNSQERKREEGACICLYLNHLLNQKRKREKKKLYAPLSCRIFHHQFICPLYRSILLYLPHSNETLTGPFPLNQSLQPQHHSSLAIPVLACIKWVIPNNNNIIY